MFKISLLVRREFCVSFHFRSRRSIIIMIVDAIIMPEASRPLTCKAPNHTTTQHRQPPATAQDLAKQRIYLPICPPSPMAESTIQSPKSPETNKTSDLPTPPNHNKHRETND